MLQSWVVGLRAFLRRCAWQRRGIRLSYWNIDTSAGGHRVATVAFVVSVGGGLMMWRSTSLRGGKIGCTFAQLSARLIARKDFASNGLSGPFHGALHIPAGFALNPRKYATGLAAAAEKAGAVIYHDTAAIKIRQSTKGHEIQTPQGRLTAEKVIIATNGYSSENVVPSLTARYMPAQSTVLVTRPLSETELEEAGWTTDFMASDTRNLLHYFRLMPDRRMLFGMRGGLLTGKSAEARAVARVRRDFEKFFSAWKHVETPIGPAWYAFRAPKRPLSGSCPTPEACMQVFVIMGMVWPWGAILAD